MGHFSQISHFEATNLISYYQPMNNHDPYLKHVAQTQPLTEPEATYRAQVVLDNPTGILTDKLTHLTDLQCSLKLLHMDESYSNQRSCVGRRLFAVLELRLESSAQHMKVKFGIKGQFG